MICPRCGGTWFYKVTVEQFSDGGYGSAQFRSLSMTPETAYICLCGTIVENKEAMGRGVDSRHGHFLSAIRTALEHQKRNSVQVVASTCASIEEVEQLRQRVNWLEEAIASFTTEQTPIEPAPIEDNIETHTSDHEGLTVGPIVMAEVAYASSATPPVGPEEMISRPAKRTGRPVRKDTPEV
jgi:hypothetical protein